VGAGSYEMVVGKPPFDSTDMRGLARAVMRGVYTPITSKYSSDLQEVVKKLLNVQPNSRPSVDEILRMPQVVGRMNLLPPDDGVPGTAASASDLVGTIHVPRKLRDLTKALPTPRYEDEVKAPAPASAEYALPQVPSATPAPAPAPAPAQQHRSPPGDPSPQVTTDSIYTHARTPDRPSRIASPAGSACARVLLTRGPCAALFPPPAAVAAAAPAPEAAAAAGLQAAGATRCTAVRVRAAPGTRLLREATISRLPRRLARQPGTPRHPSQRATRRRRTPFQEPEQIPSSLGTLCPTCQICAAARGVSDSSRSVSPRRDRRGALARGSTSTRPRAVTHARSLTVPR
jgi:hypothetical protein